MRTVVAVLIVLLLAGCVSYAKIERGMGEDKCRAVARGYWFSFNTPAVLEECRSDEDR